MGRYWMESLSADLDDEYMTNAREVAMQRVELGELRLKNLLHATMGGE
jgi:hypothetical protein